MTSRRPEPFDEIAKIVTTEKAADFHERWVLNYGHSSVAEHAIVHMAVENISRLACDTLEDNRLASYTEKSSRYQIIEPGDYYTPAELDGHPLRQRYVDTCDGLFDAYHQMVDGLGQYLANTLPRREKERESGFNLRVRREAIDRARFLLPTSTLTNVGVTMNARSLEHAIRKLLSSDIDEERSIGQVLKSEGQRIVPTLIKYADRNEYMVATAQVQREESLPYTEPANGVTVEAELVHVDTDAEAKIATALLYKFANQSYLSLWDRVQEMSDEERRRIIGQALERLGTHDVPVRELEMVDYTFDLLMDYGAYREYKRHRIQTYIPQPPTVDHGYLVPSLVQEAGLQDRFETAMGQSQDGFHALYPDLPRIAEYLVTHAHKRRVLAKLNLRECYHLFKLRTGPQAHFSLVSVIKAAMDKATEQHPHLFNHLRLRKS